MKETEEPEFNLKDFIVNLLIFCCTNMTDYISIIFCYIMFNYNGETNLTAVGGLLYSLYVIFFGCSFDFFEPVNTLSKPYYDKGNYKLFRLMVWKVAMFQMLFFLFSLIAFSVFRIILVYTNPSEFFQQAIDHSYPFIFTYGLTLMINNFMRGMDLIGGWFN